MRLTLAFVLLLAAIGTQAREGDWSLRIGVSYRYLGDIDLKDLDFQNPTLGGEYVNGATDYLGVPDNTLVLDNSLGAQNNGVGEVTLDKISADSSGENLDSDVGISIGLEHVLSEVGESEIGIELALNYTGTDINFSTEGETRTDRFDDASAPSPGAFVHDSSPIIAGGGAATVAGLRSFEMELDTLTLSMGMKAIYDADYFRLTAGAGPSVNFAYTKSSVREAVSWLSDGSELYSTQAESDESFDVLFGGYFNLGAEVVFDAQWGVGAEYRYDYTLGKVETEQVEAELDGSSGQLFLFYRY